MRRWRRGLGVVGRGRFLVVLVLLAGIVTVVVSNSWLSQRFTADIRSRAQLRLALYLGNVVSELQRAQPVPLLLSRDPRLIGALNSGDFAGSTQRLMSYIEEIGAGALTLLDSGGRVVAATNRERIGARLSSAPWFVAAQRSSETVFTTSRGPAGRYSFTYSRRIRGEGRLLGVVAVSVDLAALERRWAGLSDAVMVSDAQGTILLSTEREWRGLNEEEALAQRSAPSAIRRALAATSDWPLLAGDTYLGGEAVMRNEARIPFRGWKLISFTSFAPVRAKVNGVLAAEMMGFALLLAAGFYLASRRARSRSDFFQRESAGLRTLNARLQREIAERRKVERSLSAAEQTLAQSSKLAALGEMSAAVSHELNQPLAAMKTYLAGAKLLTERGRGDETEAALARIDELIERMGRITRQLKTHARGEGGARTVLDLRQSVDTAIEMMQPQLRQRGIEIERALPPEAVPVNADRVRLEQIIINLLRNALDATRDVTAPKISVLVAAGDDAHLTVRDNGPGIADLEALFEPFYTTKKPGQGLGLGLAISAGIAKDFGGRLTAMNASGGGAVFELSLPLAEGGRSAAE